MTDVPHKVVDGVVVPMTPEEIAMMQEMGAKSTQQRKILTINPGPGPTYKETLDNPPPKI